MRIHDRLHMRGRFLIDPGGEIALRLIDEPRPGGTVIQIHRNLDVVAVLFAGGQIADLLQTGIPRFAGGHAAIQRHGAGIGDGAAGRGGIKDLRSRDGAAAEETRILKMLAVEPGIEHFHKTPDRVAVVGGILIEGADILQNIRHLIDRVVAALRRAAVAGDALDVDPDLHPAAVPAVNAAVGRLGRYHKLRRDAVLAVDILPAQPVAILLLNRRDDKNAIAVRNQPEILHDARAVNGGNHAALLIGAAAAVDDLVGLIALVGILRPVGDVADADGVDMPVERDDLFTLTHPAQRVALGIDLRPVEAELFHLGDGAADHALLIAALARNGDQIAQKTGHCGQIGLGCFSNR